MFGLEASPTTYAALAATPVWAYAAPGVVSILPLAGDDKPGSVVFDECPPGEEKCAMRQGARGGGTKVQATSVDAFRAERGLGSIFWLAIDTEGHDPAVLQGAEATLSQGAVQVRTGWKAD